MELKEYNAILASKDLSARDKSLFVFHTICDRKLSYFLHLRIYEILNDYDETTKQFSIVDTILLKTKNSFKIIKHLLTEEEKKVLYEYLMYLIHGEIKSEIKFDRVLFGSRNGCYSHPITRQQATRIINKILEYAGLTNPVLEYSATQAKIRTKIKSIAIHEEIFFKYLTSFCSKPIKRQYLVLNYKVDFFIEFYNLAIEFDEYQHRNHVIKKYDKCRQKRITDKTGCIFIRVDYENPGDGLLKIVNFIKSHERRVVKSNNEQLPLMQSALL